MTYTRQFVRGQGETRGRNFETEARRRFKAIVILVNIVSLCIPKYQLSQTHAHVYALTEYLILADHVRCIGLRLKRFQSDEISPTLELMVRIRNVVRLTEREKMTNGGDVVRLSLGFRASGRFSASFHWNKSPPPFFHTRVSQNGIAPAAGGGSLWETTV